MVSSFLVALALSTAVTAASAARPEILFDGRLPWNFKLEALDSYSTSKYNAEYVLGAGQKWSEVVKLPERDFSLFDLEAGARALEVTINDKSIFAPGGNPQAGFRRSELLPISNNGTDPTVQGISTFHFSLKPDFHRPLNLSHQYELVFVETNDYSSHVWTIKLGTPFGSEKVPSDNAGMLRLESSTAGGKAGDVLFQVPWVRKEGWHNFAISTDWVKNKIWAHYSPGYNPLRKVVRPRANDATGKGQAHIGVLKLPTDSTNPSQNGYQQSNLNEGIIYGGIFVERGDKTTTKPTND